MTRLFVDVFCFFGQSPAVSQTLRGIGWVILQLFYLPMWIWVGILFSPLVLFQVWFWVKERWS